MSRTERDGPDPIEGLLAQCLEHPPERWRAAVASVCARHPDHAAAIERRFSALEAIGLDAPDTWTEQDRTWLGELAGALSEDDPAQALPRTLAGRYRLERTLGQGAMGVVFAATDLELDRQVAVKVLRDSLFDDAQNEQRFLREAELLGKLAHPHVVRLYDRGHDQGGGLYLVMEYLEGASLAELLHGSRGAGPPGIAEKAAARVTDARPERAGLRLAVHWIAQVAAGLTAAHEAGVLHRDLKPSNVFVRRDGSALLLDFGIAAHADHAGLTATGHVLGTPCYMAPEQARGVARGAAIDVYGLTATLYHLVTHRPPYDGGVMEVLDALAKTDPIPSHRLVPGLPRDLRAILERGMERDPRRRYASVAALEQDLRAFLDHRPVAARPSTALGRALRRLRRRPSVPALAVAATALLALGTLVYTDWREADAARVRDAVASEYRHLPPALALQGEPEQRTETAWVAARRTNVQRLDRILALAPDEVPARILRAALRRDRGDAQAAADDMAALAEHHGSPYLLAVAAHYRRGASPLDLDAVGAEPESAIDRYVAAFHVRRSRRPGFVERARELLTPIAERYVPAAQLGLSVLHAKPQDRARAAEAIEHSLRHTTAVTCYHRGFAHLSLNEAEAAAACFEESLALCPEQYNAAHNLGLAYLKLNRLDEAAVWLARAAERAPDNWRTPHTLSKVEQRRRNFERAYALAEGLPVHPPDQATIRLERMALVRIEEALAGRRTGAPRGLPAAAEAAALLGDAARHADATAEGRLRRSLAVADSLSLLARGTAATKDAVFRAYLETLREDRLPGTLGAEVFLNLAWLMPETLSRESTAELNEFLTESASDLAGPRR